MTGRPTLAAAEAMMLLEPNATKPHEALKLTVMALLLRGMLRFREATRPGILREKRVKILVPAKSAEGASALEAAVLRAIGAPKDEGHTIPQLIRRLRKAFGSGFKAFRDEHILPGLVDKGLLASRGELFLFLFARARHHLTPEGEVERTRLQALLTDARRLPALQARDPERALAILAALGTSVLLAEELRPHLPEILEALEPQAREWEIEFEWEASAQDWDVEALDAGFAAIDAGFDAAGDGGDGGGDGGGGGD